MSSTMQLGPFAQSHIWETIEGTINRPMPTFPQLRFYWNALSEARATARAQDHELVSHLGIEASPQHRKGQSAGCLTMPVLRAALTALRTCRPSTGLEPHRYLGTVITIIGPRLVTSSAVPCLVISRR